MRRAPPPIVTPAQRAGETGAQSQSFISPAAAAPDPRNLSATSSTLAFSKTAATTLRRSRFSSISWIAAPSAHRRSSSSCRSRCSAAILSVSAHSSSGATLIPSCRAASASSSAPPRRRRASSSTFSAPSRRELLDLRRQQRCWQGQIRMRGEERGFDRLRGFFEGGLGRFVFHHPAQLPAAGLVRRTAAEPFQHVVDVAFADLRHRPPHRERPRSSGGSAGKTSKIAATRAPPSSSSRRGAATGRRPRTASSRRTAASASFATAGAARPARNGAAAPARAPCRGGSPALRPAAAARPAAGRPRRPPPLLSTASSSRHSGPSSCSSRVSSSAIAFPRLPVCSYDGEMADKPDPQVLLAAGIAAHKKAIPARPGESTSRCCVCGPSIRTPCTSPGSSPTKKAATPKQCS